MNLREYVNLRSLGLWCLSFQNNQNVKSSLFEYSTILATVKAERNVTTTQCFPFNVDLASLPKGAMTLMVSYESANHLGESEKFEVIIP